MKAAEQKITGLTSGEVAERKRQGLVNGNFSVRTKSVGQIIYTNVFTLFNFINAFLAVCLILVHSYKNMLFIFVVFWNILIGIVQELRSKRVIDKLSLLSEPVVRVLRDGEYSDISIEDVVLDDIFMVKNGNQVCTDAVIVEGKCEVNESLLTGESDPVFKKCGDEILSGSFIISGNVLAQAVHVGKDNYVNKITGQAKYLKKPNSEILTSIQTIIKIISMMLVPVICLLYWNQIGIEGNTVKDAVVGTVAAVIGMIPSGLVLLTSMVLAVSVIRLGKKNTLVQELYCIETLARVDTLCLDKTGTITEGVMDVDGIEIVHPAFSREKIDEIIYFFTHGLNDDNPTFQALAAYSDKLYQEQPEQLKEKTKEYQVREKISFSSDKKWSLVDFETQGTFVLGALEFILPHPHEELKAHAARFAKDGVRVLLIAHSDSHCDGTHLPDGLEAYAFVLMTDRIRANAPETLRYFRNQGVTMKVISGDNPQTVSNIAKRAGLPDAENFVDAGTLITDEAVGEAALKYTVFGRVTPRQKLKLVQALKEAGHIVAMTGDGVNDVMALKEADCSIAMQSGSDAARNVSQLVLMDSDFASMPYIVAEGRRTINNIQRSAALYLTKTIYSAILAIAFIFINITYPFQPIQQTLIGAVTIGIPSFILALEPNLNRIKGKFLMNVMRLAVPGGLIVLTNVAAAEITGFLLQWPEKQTSTIAFLGLAIASLVELFKVCKPFNTLRIVMCGILISSFAAAVLFFGSFFEVYPLTFIQLLFVLILFFATPMLHMTYSIAIDKMMGNSPNVYRIFPVCIRKEEGIENVILVHEEVEEKDYADVAAQMMGLRVLHADKVAYFGKPVQGGDIRVEYAYQTYDKDVVMAAAKYYAQKHSRRRGKDVMEVKVETADLETPVKVLIDLKNHRVIIKEDEIETKYQIRMLKSLKITF